MISTDIEKLDDEIFSYIEKVPDWMPAPIKEMINAFCHNVYNAKQNGMDDDYNKGLNFIKKAFPSFVNETTKDIWIELAKENSEGAQKVAERLLYMENLIDYFFEFREEQKQAINRAKKYLKRLDYLIEYRHKGSFPPLGYDYTGRGESSPISIDILSNTFSYCLKNDGKNPFKEFIKSINPCFLCHLQKERNEVAQYIGLKKINHDIRNYQSSNSFPVTRQSRNTGRATIYAICLNNIFKKLYGKPMHLVTTVFVNIIHTKQYSQEEIITMTSKGKKKMIKSNYDTPMQSFIKAVIETELFTPAIIDCQALPFFVKRGEEVIARANYFIEDDI